MQNGSLIIVTALFLAPFAARAQSNPTPTPDPSEAPPVIIVQNSPSGALPAPPPGAVIRTGGCVGGVPGPMTFGTKGKEKVFFGPVKLEPLEKGEFGPGGAWWKNSEIVSKLQLSDDQVARIGKTFLDHKLNLIDLQADLDKQELRLQPLLDVDQPDQGKVGAQIDAITAARGKLEKENAMMMLDIRRGLSVEQWKKLKTLDAAQPERRDVFYFRGGPGAGVNTEGPLPPPLPEPPR